MRFPAGKQTKYKMDKLSTHICNCAFAKAWTSEFRSGIGGLHVYVNARRLFKCVHKKRRAAEVLEVGTRIIRARLLLSDSIILVQVEDQNTHETCTFVVSPKLQFASPES
jgi:hypothetical protein